MFPNFAHIVVPAVGCFWFVRHYSCLLLFILFVIVTVAVTVVVFAVVGVVVNVVLVVLMCIILPRLLLFSFVCALFLFS